MGMICVDVSKVSLSDVNHLATTIIIMGLFFISQTTFFFIFHLFALPLSSPSALWRLKCYHLRCSISGLCTLANFRAHSNYSSMVALTLTHVLRLITVLTENGRSVSRIIHLTNALSVGSFLFFLFLVRPVSENFPMKYIEWEAEKGR